MIEKIAKITKTHLGFEDHGAFTVAITANYGDGVFGGIPHMVLGQEHGISFIKKFIRSAGVESWEELRGRTIMVIYEKDEWSGSPIGIKNLPTEPGETFIFKELFE